MSKENISSHFKSNDFCLNNFTSQFHGIDGSAVLHYFNQQAIQLNDTQL